MSNINCGRLQGKVAVVTGASKGIGAGIAKCLGAEGAAVIVNYASDRIGADNVVDTIANGGGQAISVHGDVGKPDDAKRVIAEATNNFGRLDILVNNAGVYSFAPFDQFSESTFHRMMTTNVLGPFLTIREALNHFGPEGGSIINIGSTASTAAPPTLSIYVATKMALDGITRVLAKELGPKGIRVNSVNPGFTVTEGAKAAGVMGTPFETALLAETPLGRLGQPEEIGSVVAFLASNDSRWITGELIRASGGLHC